MPNVTLLDEHDIVELTSTPDHHRVTGARVVNRRTREDATLSADLVVDATGRAARTPTWLNGLGYDRPREDHVVVQLTYVSQLLRMAPDALHELGFLVGIVPGRPHGLGMSPLRERLLDVHRVWHSGSRATARPCGDVRVRRGLRTGPDAGCGASRRTHRRADAAPQPSSQWRRYDKMRRFPEGLLVTGDAICSFNPIYGQGMTVAALEALALRDCLSRGTKDLARRFFRAAAAPIRQAWQLSANPDLSLPEIDGTPPLLARLLNVYVDRVLTAAEYDTAAVNQFFRVTSLIDPATRLLRPAIMWRAARANHRRRLQGIDQLDSAADILTDSVAG